MTARRKSLAAGVVLAAGLSRRFGGQKSKLLARIGGETLVRHVTRAALGSDLDQVIVVLGHAAEEIRSSLGDLDVEWVRNPRYSEGQSTSVRAGLQQVDPTMNAVLFLPGDQPLLSSRSIDQIIEARIDSGLWIVRPRARGRHGAPVLWDRSLFPELLTLEGDSGGRQLLERYADRVLEVEIENPLELTDVDTIEDLRELDRSLQ